MDIARSLDALRAHAEKQATKSAYAEGDGLYYLNDSEAERKAVSKFNVRKYFIRYFAKKNSVTGVVAKAANPEDLLKLAHYALLEWQTATVGDVELTPEPDPRHTIHGTCIIDMGRSIRVRCEIDGKPATLSACMSDRYWRHNSRVDGLQVTLRGYNLRYDSDGDIRMWLLDDCELAGVDLEPQLSGGNA